MKNINKVAVIGGTGKAGKYLVKELLNQDFKIKLLIRNPAKIPPPHPNLEVVLGDVRDRKVIQVLVSECLGLISMLGMGIPPSEPTIFSQATRNILEVLSTDDVKRYILITGLNVDTESDKKNGSTQAATEWMYANFPVSTRDRQSEYELLLASQADWTLVRLPLIDQTDEAPEIAVSLDNCPGQGISATSLAKFLVGILQTGKYFKEAPFIANKN